MAAHPESSTVPTNQHSSNIDSNTIDHVLTNTNTNQPMPTVTNPNENIPYTSNKQSWQPDYHGPGPRIEPDGTPLPHGQMQGIRGMKPNTPAENRRSQQAWGRGDEEVDTLRQSWGGRHPSPRGPATNGVVKPGSAGGIHRMTSMQRSRAVLKGRRFSK
jgi:hypothetical protein